MRKSLFLLLGGAILISGCNQMASHHEGPFQVRVLSTEGSPVAGVTIEGGIDWNAFRVVTDTLGRATLPDHAWGEKAAIYTDNFFPMITQVGPQTDFSLKPAPRPLRLIGKVAGWAVRFGSGTLITVEYQGGYHVYAYSDQEVMELATAQLAAHAIKETQIHGEELWLSTPGDGIYVYSLANPENPALLFHLAIPGDLDPFVKMEDKIIVGNPWKKEALRVYSYQADGQFQEISRFGSHMVVRMFLVGNCLVFTNYYDNLPGIYDLTDPSNPMAVSLGAGSPYWAATLWGNYCLQIPNISEPSGESIRHGLVDLSNPFAPVPIGNLTADAFLFALNDDSTALGDYYAYTNAVGILVEDPAHGLKTVSIITTNTAVRTLPHKSEGSAPPFFIIGGQLWRWAE